MPFPDASSSAIECSRAAAFSRDSVVFSFSSTRSTRAPIFDRQDPLAANAVAHHPVRMTYACLGSRLFLDRVDPVERTPIRGAEHCRAESGRQHLAGLGHVPLLDPVAGQLTVEDTRSQLPVHVVVVGVDDGR